MANKKVQAQPYGYNMQGIPGAQQMIMQPGMGYPQYPTYPPPGQFGPAQPGFQVPPMPVQQGLTQNIPGMLPIEESYIENILRLNRGKVATVYMTFENNREWNAKIFKGLIEAAGRDHLILSDPQTGMRYLLLMIYLDYITFDGEINYDIQNTLASYPPR